MRKIVVKNLNACPCQVVKDVHVYIFLYEIFNQIFLFTETWVLFSCRFRVCACYLRDSLGHVFEL